MQNTALAPNTDTIQLSPNAPAYLKNGLSFMGNRRLLDSVKKASLIGSRKPTDKGAAAATILTDLLVAKHYTTISGLALGIDTIVHRQTLDRGGSTIAVLGTPIDRIYPKENTVLHDRIVREGLVISQFETGSPTRPSNFPQRNRTMAYISDLTIICDATEKSGTRHQAAEALRLGKKVFILSHIINDQRVQWALDMIQKGAQKIDINSLEKLPL